MKDYPCVTGRVLGQLTRISIDRILWDVIGDAVVGRLDIIKLLVRTGVMACQRTAIAEYVIAALCLISKFQLTLLVDSFRCRLCVHELPMVGVPVIASGLGVVYWIKLTEF